MLFCIIPQNTNPGSAKAMPGRDFFAPSPKSLCSVPFPIQLRNQLISDKMIFVGFAAAGPCVAAAENMQ